jgi:peptide-methionine (S)-S-oxide reductase
MKIPPAGAGGLSSIFIIAIDSLAFPPSRANNSLVMPVVLHMIRSPWSLAMIRRMGVLAMLMLTFAQFACGRPDAALNPPAPSESKSAGATHSDGYPTIDTTAVDEPRDQPHTAVFAGGCFWCTEAVFEQLAGVLDVMSGYAGGTPQTATYEAVCSGATDHAEAIRITYDPRKISFGQLLKVFFTVAHDPTQLNRQGADHGRQYRSAIFFESAAQRAAAAAYIEALEAAQVFKSKIVTTLEPFEGFFPAEDYHQNFVQENPRQGYVVQQALPKVDKVRAKFPDQVK